MPFNPYMVKIKRRYDPELHVENFETSEQLEKIDTHNVTTLQAGDTKCRNLAKRLENSWQGDPSLSPAKFSDLSAERRWFCSETIRLHEQVGDTVRINPIPVRWQRPKGELSTFDMVKELRREKRFFERTLSADTALIMGMDFTLNTDSKNPGELIWQPHIHGALFEATKDDINALKKRYPANPIKSVPRPIKTTGIKDPFEQLSYLLKISFKRWKPTYDREHPMEKMPNLRADELRELLLFLDQYELSDLVLMHGIRRFGSELRFT